MTKLSETEHTALALIKEHGGSMLVSNVPDRNGKGVFGEVIPGMRVYRALDRRGLVIITEEEPDEDGFCWTPSIELTDIGTAELAKVP